MKKFIGSIIILLLINGCATAPIATSGSNGRTLIESEPPGVKIEINSQYVGTTPLRVDIPRRRTCVFCDTLESSLIVAYPNIAGQQIQKKYLSGSDPTPTHMFFDMRLVAVPDSLNINVNPSERTTREPTPDEVRRALAKARAEGDKKFESEILQYAKEHGVNVQ